MPEKMPEVSFLKQACLNYCFRAYRAYVSSGMRQARLQALSFQALRNNAVCPELPNQGKGHINCTVCAFLKKMPELPFLKQACLNYCFRAYAAYFWPGTRQASGSEH